MNNIISKIVAIIALVGIVGCISSVMVKVSPVTAAVRLNAKHEFPAAIKWAAEECGWQILHSDEDAFTLEREYHGAKICIKVYVKYDIIYAEHVKSSGLEYVASSGMISRTFDVLTSELVRHVADKCNSTIISDSDVAKYKQQFKGFNANGIYDFVSHDWEEMKKARHRIGLSCDLDDHILREVKRYECYEVPRCEHILSNSVNDYIKCMSSYLSSNTVCLVDQAWTNLALSVKESHVSAIAKWLSCSNVVVSLSSGNMLCRPWLLQDNDKKLLQHFCYTTLACDCCGLAQYMLDLYTERQFGFATVAVIADGKELCKKWAYEHSPEGIKAARVKKLAGDPPEKDFEYFVNVLKNEDDNGYVGRPRGLKAEGYTKRCDEIAMRNYEDAIRDIDSPALRSRFRVSVIESMGQSHTECWKYEQEQMAIGVQQALSMMKDTLKSECIDYVTTRVVEYYKDGGDVSKDDVVATIKNGIVLRVKNINNGYDQALQRDAFSSSYMMEKNKRAYLKDIATSLVSDLCAIKRRDFVWKLGEADFWQKHFLLSIADATKFKELGVEPNESTITNSDVSIVTGTGWFVGSNLVVTCQHVVDSGKAIRCKMQNGFDVEATCVAFDKDNDLAVLRIAGDRASTVWLPLRTSVLKLADGVCTFGYPLPSLLGQKLKYTEGSISSATGIVDDPRAYQISVPLQPGNSGGALLDDKGFVAGVTSSALNAIKAARLTGSLPQNVNYAVKVRYLIALMDDNGLEYFTDASKCGFQTKDISERAKATVMITVER